MRRLVAIEDDNAHADAGKLFAVDPQDATGVAIPCWTIGAARPAAGTIIGEAFLDTSTHTGWVWTAQGWSAIVQSSILSYANDGAVYADATQVPGAYGISKDTGNMFVMSATGWRQVGARVYATQAAANAETNVSDGSLAWLQAEQIMVIRDSGAWVRLVDTPHISYGDVLPVAPVTGDLNYEPTAKLLKLWTGAAWIILPGMPNPTPANGIPVVENNAWVVKEFNAYADARYYPKAQVYTKTEVDLKAIGQEYFYNHSNHSASEHLITVSGTNYINEYIIADVFSQQLNNGSPQMYVEFEDGTAIHFGSATNFDHQYHSIQYEAGGVRDSGATFNTNHWARWCYRSITNYDQASGTPLFCRWTLFNISGYWQMGFNGNYKSSNGTSMIFGGGLEYNKASPYRIAKFGIRQFQTNSENRSNGICSIHARVK